MPKKLIVCCDGTWNVPDQRGNPTNVVKMVRAIEPADDAGVPQVVYYDPGVGTGNPLDRVVGGGLGVGLSRNVQEAYQFLVHNYHDGDLIYLFGFSRGAYTVRSLAGMLGAVGLIHKGDANRMGDAYAYYRTRPEDRGGPAGRALLDAVVNGRDDDRTEGRDRRRHPDVHMIGVWDTVGSLGVPIGFLRWVGRRRFEFHDTGLGRHIRHAYHALAIDEHRRPFEPAVWKRGDYGPGVDQDVEQVWFPGAHSNVGGGYPDSGLSDTAFLWMAGKAAACGLKLDPAYLTAKVRARIESSRRELIEARSGKYRLWRTFYRPLCATDPKTERIHRTVLERCGAADPNAFVPHPYDPPNLRPCLGPDGALRPGLVASPDAGAEVREAAAQPSTAEQRQDAATDAPRV